MKLDFDKRPGYNLNFVVRETGVKAERLRAWERRYGLPLPGRSSGGHRLYSQYDVETVRWLLNQQDEKGMRISKAVDLWRNIQASGRDPLTWANTRTTTFRPALSASPKATALAAIRADWINSSLTFDEINSEEILTRSFALYPVETVSMEILQKGLSTIGRLWFEGKASVQQEHFASELTIRRLHALIAASPLPILKSKILMACPPKEQHAFPALLLTLLLRNRGWDVINIGTNVPKDQFSAALAQVNPDLVVLTATRLTAAATLKELASDLEEHRISSAYGGWIFNQLPELSPRIPGHFLGKELPAAIVNIEHILRGSPLQLERKSVSEEFAQTASHFIVAKPSIDARIHQWARDEFSDETTLETIALANQYISTDMVAALRLGDIGFLDSTIHWLEGFLAHRGISGKIMEEYLLVFKETAKTMLHDPGRHLVDWLADTSRASKNDERLL